MKKKEDVIADLKKLTHNGKSHLDTDEILWILERESVREYVALQLSAEVARLKSINLQLELKLANYAGSA